MFSDSALMPSTKETAQHCAQGRTAREKKKRYKDSVRQIFMEISRTSRLKISKAWDIYCSLFAMILSILFCLIQCYHTQNKIASQCESLRYLSSNATMLHKGSGNCFKLSQAVILKSHIIMTIKTSHFNSEKR